MSENNPDSGEKVWWLLPLTLIAVGAVCYLMAPTISPHDEGFLVFLRIASLAAMLEGGRLIPRKLE